MEVARRGDARARRRSQLRPVRAVVDCRRGSNVRRITDRGTFQQPFWSPDGSAIAVSARIDEPRHRIYVMAADDSHPRPIRQPSGADNVHSAWSPNGRSIAFTSVSEGG